MIRSFLGGKGGGEQYRALLWFLRRRGEEEGIHCGAALVILCPVVALALSFGIQMVLELG